VPRIETLAAKIVPSIFRLAEYYRGEADCIKLANILRYVLEQCLGFKVSMYSTATD